MAQSAWHSKNVNKTIEVLQTDAQKGLGDEEARKRLLKYGPNSFEEKKKISPVIIFLEQFNDVMIWVLIAAALISGILLGEIIDAIVIGIILFLNAILGFVQTYKAEKALEALKALAAPTATVIRGTEKEIKAIDLVPGDLVLLKAGDKIGADARLIEIASLQTSEASLTGESTPVSKSLELIEEENIPISERKNMLFLGTSIARGRAKAIIVATGSSTEMGKIASLIETKKEPTPLQKELKSLGFKLAAAIISIAIIVFLIGVIKGNSAPSMFLTAVALAVAAIPEGLPAIVTITLAIGVQFMARENSIVRRLHAVETLGSTNYIATDKTGTLTLNEMTVKRLFLDNELYRVKDGVAKSLEAKEAPRDLNKLMLTAVIANDSRKTEDGTFVGEPTELALVQAGSEFGYEKSELDTQYERIDEIPFESERKEMTTLNKYEEKFISFTKGAVEVLINQSDYLLDKGETRPFSEEEKKHMINVANQEAATGYRMLGFAYKTFNVKPKINELERNLTFVGMAGLLDPPRPEVAEAIRVAKEAGINIAMVTGDHMLTAQKIAQEIGLSHGDKTLSGKELNDLSSHELTSNVEKIRVYARVDPSHKVKIVEALKEKGHIVAVTGDGVNDAPALKKADIGVAMGITGTDVSKEASDMILADDNFATIIKAIRYGRMIFDNLQKFISFLLSANVSEVLTIFLGILLFPAKISVLFPIQILWINLVTDAFPALALGVDPPALEIMKRKPRKKDEGILNAKQASRILSEGIFLTIAALGAFSLALFWLKLSITKAQTIVFTTLVLLQLMHAFNYRSNKTIFSTQTFKNKWLIAAFAGSFSLQLAVIYVPFIRPLFKTSFIGINEWALILSAVIIAEIFIDRLKVQFFSKQRFLIVSR